MKLQQHAILFFIIFASLSKTTVYAACPAPGCGIIVNGTVETESGYTITTTDNTTPGIDANMGGTINFSNGSISTTGMRSHGAYAQNQTTITLNNIKVTTAGENNAHGLFIRDGSAGNLIESSIQTSGTNGLGIFMVGLSAGNRANISNSTVMTSGSGIDSGANAIKTFAIAGITNTIQSTNSTFSAENDDLILIAGGIANMTFNNVSAKASSNHRLLIVDGLIRPATLSWAADSSNLAGNMQVGSRNIANITLERSTWTGAAFDVTNLTLISSDWNLTANSTITDALLNNGLIDFVSEGNIFKTLTVSGPYTGQKGIISLNTLLAGDNSPSDLLIINGNTATGSTILNIKITTGHGALTTNNGILIVNAINGGTTAPGAFSLGNDYVIAGPYQYELFRGSVDASGIQNWYLRSSMPATPSDIDPPGPLIPNYRPEVSLYAAIPSTALLFGRTLLDTLHQRVGDVFQQCGCPEEECSFFKHYWSRVIERNGRQYGRNIFHQGPNFNYNLTAFQLGLDVYRRVRWDCTRDHIGVLGAAGRGRSSVRHFTHIHAGTDKFEAYSAGAYWTHYGSPGWYVDGVFETNWYENVKGHSKRIRSLKTHGVEYAGSLEGGYPWKVKCLILEPQAQVISQSLFLHRSKDIAARVHFRNAHSFLGRLGLRLANTWSLGCLPSSEPRLVQAWMRADIWRNFNNRSKTYFSSATGPIGLPSSLRGTWFEGTLGLSAQLTNILAVYGSFTGNVYFNGRGHSYNGIAGLMANF
jgi:outer membrane autotransporter protein